MHKTRLFLASVGLSGQYKQYNPPLGPLYLAAWLREKFALDIQVVAQRTEGIDCDALVRKALAFEPDIVGLSSLTPHAHLLPGIVRALRQASPDTLIIIGGPHVSAFREQALRESGADIAVAGEGERAMEMVVRAYREGGGMDHIRGLIHRAPEGNIVTNPGTSPVVESLDDLPFPAYDLIDIRKYWRLPSQNLLPYPRKYISLFSSRGCPYNCAYCHNVFGRRFRAHSPERIAQEIAHYRKTYGVEEVAFVDDCFNLDRERVIRFSERLLETTGPIKIFFPNGVRADLLNETTIEALVQAGMYCCSFALESGSPRIQQLIQKRLDIDKFLAAVSACEARGVFCNGFAMLGFPTETECEMEQTIRVAISSRLHTIEFYTVTPFPNTPLYDYVIRHMPEKLANVSYANEEYWRMPINLSATPDNIFFLYQRKAFRKFYLNIGRLCRILKDYPKRFYLPMRFPLLLRRMTKGL